MSTLSRRTFSLSAVGLLSGGLLAACGTESDEVEPTMTRVTAPGAPPTAAPTVAGASPAASPAASASSPVPPSDGGAQPDGGGTDEPPAVTGVESLPTSVTINFVDFAFEPKDVTIAAGQDVTFTFTNGGAAQHHYKIDDPAYESEILNAGESNSLVINVPAGTYESYCPVPGHKDLGMVGTLTAQ